MNSFRKIKFKWYFIIAEPYLKDPLHIGWSMKLANYLLSRNDQQKPPIKINDEETEAKNGELEELIKKFSLQIYRLVRGVKDEIDLEKGDYDYIKTNKVHFLEYQQYKHDVDLINMEEVESVDLDEIEQEYEQYETLFVSDFFFRRSPSF